MHLIISNYFISIHEYSDKFPADKFFIYISYFDEFIHGVKGYSHQELKTGYAVELRF